MCGQAFVDRMKALVSKSMKIDNIVVNAGILKYPNVREVFFFHC